LNLTCKLKRLRGQGNMLRLIHKRSKIKSNILDHNLKFEQTLKAVWSKHAGITGR
jgi:hypothetical protein